jgi:hypothetical protein
MRYLWVVYVNLTEIRKTQSFEVSYDEFL